MTSASNLPAFIRPPTLPGTCITRPGRRGPFCMSGAINDGTAWLFSFF